MATRLATPVSCARQIAVSAAVAALFLATHPLLSRGISAQAGAARSARALQGQLRVERANGRVSFADDSGPRRVLFTSWFPALRIWHDNPREAESVLDEIARAGYQGVRVFRALAFDAGEKGDGPYWTGRGVDPAWAVDALVPFLRACRERGLRVQLTEGHKWADPVADELAFTRKVVDAIHAAGLDDTIALWENWNEGFQNTAFGTTAKQVDIGQQMFAIVRRGLSPAPLVAQTSFNDEDPEALRQSSLGADVTVIHGAREWPDAVARVFELWQRETPHRALWHGEPTGPGEGVSVARLDDPGKLTALYALIQLTGQVLVSVSGPGIWYRAPLDSVWGFRELPDFLSRIPEDIALWSQQPGGRLGWWTRDEHAVTVAVEGWEVVPPRPVKQWQAFGPAGKTLDGIGDIRLPPGYGGALIIATLGN